MTQGKKFLALAAIFAGSMGSQAFAVDQGCIVLKSVAEIEKEVVDANGAKTTKLVPADKVVPGVETERIAVWGECRSRMLSESSCG